MYQMYAQDRYGSVWPMETPKPIKEAMQLHKRFNDWCWCNNPGGRYFVRRVK